MFLEYAFRWPAGRDQRKELDHRLDETVESMRQLTALQARLLAKTGKHKEAIAAAEKSLQLAKANDVNMADLEAEMMEWKKAL